MRHLSPAGRAGARATALSLLVLVVTTCERQGPTSIFERRPSAAVALPGSTDPQVFIGAGDIGICGSANDQKTATVIDGLLVSAPDATVFTLGDNAYPNGSVTDFSECYTATWGRHLGRTFPSAGERDYNTAGAAGYFGYFGEAAGDPAKGYYSYDIGASWHVVVLNSKLPTTAGSAQEQWLKADLALSSRPCTVAIWHTPRFSSSTTTVSASLQPLWDALYSAGAELILNAHYRNYERFAPQRPDGSADPDLGIRQFVVGTGGAGGTSSFGVIRPNSEARSVGTLGVLKLVLNAGSYSWEFVPIAGATYTDSGTGACHGSQAPTANPGGPYQADGAITLDGSASADPQGDTPLSYAWDFGDGSTGTGVKPTHSYAADGVYTVTLVITDSKGNSSAPATTTATAANVPPSVSAPNIATRSGETATLTLSVGDPAADDGPWAYTIDWGDGTAPTAGSIAALGTPLSVTHVYQTAGQRAGLVTVTDKDGGVGTDVFEAAVTDPAPARVFVGAGDIGVCGASGDQEASKLIDAIVATDPTAMVFAAGDLAYENSTAAELTNCYGPSWGRHLSRTQAAMGDNEYNIDPNPAWDYFGDRAGPRGKGYRSFDLGDWHIIYLNDNPAHVPFAAGSQQDLWLQSDLAANTKRCTIAIFHQPYTYSNTSTTTIRKNWKILWDRLYAAGAEIVLNGHVHRYERFAPQTPDRVRDDARGIRQFIVGTGGAGVVGTPTVLAPNSETRSSTRGVLKLTLQRDSYEWQFIPVAGKTFTDSGSGTCHD
jgi:PKD repeat protein